MPEPVIQLSRVDKIHSLSSGRARSFKSLMLSLLRTQRPGETIEAARDISLDVEKGSAVGIIGMNGAGKTTLLRLIAGITEPTRGQIRTSGRILPLLELGAGFHPDLSGYENIFLQGSLFGLRREEVRRLLPDIVAFAEIEDFLHMPVRHYSSGMYMRLGFSISTHMEPDILLVDEAFSVGDLYFQEKCMKRMEEFHEKGGTFLLVSHNNSMIEQVCDETIWIDHGQIRARGKPAEVTSHYTREMIQTYFANPVPIRTLAQISSGRQGRFGSGEITFDPLEILDGAGRPGHLFAHGAPMQFRIRYRVNRPVTGPIDCTVVVFSYRGHPAWCISTRDMEVKVHPYPQGGEILFRVNRLDLSPTTYVPVVSLCKGGDFSPAGIYDMHARLYAFRVAGEENLSPLAAVDPPCRWEHIPAGAR